MTALREAFSEEYIEWMKREINQVMLGDVSTHVAAYNLSLMFSDPGCEYTAFCEAVQRVRNAAEGVVLKCSKIQEKL